MKTENDLKADAERMASYLALFEDGGWVAGAEVAESLGWTERHVRAVASASDSIVSFPGSPGYKLLRECSRVEFDHFCAALRSQALRMLDRVARAEAIFGDARSAVIRENENAPPKIDPVAELLSNARAEWERAARAEAEAEP